MDGLWLGIDTGGTYTDAVLVDARSHRVIVKAKALTQRHDLAASLGEALARILTGISTPSIRLVSISTTLATNALVENSGGRVCSLLIGYDSAMQARARLASGPAYRVQGGHDGLGEEVAPLDEADIARIAATHKEDCDAFAVSSLFSVRNPDHERRARTILRSLSGKPVSCGHELTAGLDAPRRALTAALNAQLIPKIAALIDAMSCVLARQGITAPLMVVSGQGTLLGAEEARLRPVETILSGPAASLIGMQFLSQRDDLILADLGGTTTDIAILEHGRPRIDGRGARVGGHETMVQAISLHSFGLGGDSHVVYEDGDFRLGPRRVIPLSLLAHSHPDIIGDIARCTHAPLFLFKAPNAESRGRTRRELELLHRLTERPVERARLDLGPGAQAALETLLAREAVWASGLTPTDAQHVLGHQHSWSLPAAQAGFDVLAAITGRTSQECAQAIQARVVSESCRLLLEVALDGMDMPALVARAAAGGRHIGRVRFSMGLDLPLAGAGASAPLYYPEVARRLHTPLILHAHSDVTNAVGAAVGAVRGESAILISQPQPGLFRVHGPEITDFAVETEAFETAERLAEHAALAQAHRSGALRCHVKKHLEKKIYDKTRWIEAWVIAQATGRPEGTET